MFSACKGLIKKENSPLDENCKVKGNPSLLLELNDLQAILNSPQVLKKMRHTLTKFKKLHFKKYMPSTLDGLFYRFLVNTLRKE